MIGSLLVLETVLNCLETVLVEIHMHCINRCKWPITICMRGHFSQNVTTPLSQFQTLYTKHIWARRDGSHSSRCITDTYISLLKYNHFIVIHTFAYSQQFQLLHINCQPHTIPCKDYSPGEKCSGVTPPPPIIFLNLRSFIVTNTYSSYHNITHPPPLKYRFISYVAASCVIDSVDFKRRITTR